MVNKPYPKLTVDCIVKYHSKIVLIKRKNPPFGWALPGGFVDINETLEAAVRRELMEEVNVELKDLRQFHAYSDPKRDPRYHTVSVVFTATTENEPKAGDDAESFGCFTEEEIKEMIKSKRICFDHSDILTDYFKGLY